VLVCRSRGDSIESSAFSSRGDWLDDDAQEEPVGSASNVAGSMDCSRLKEAGGIKDGERLSGISPSCNFNIINAFAVAADSKWLLRLPRFPLEDLCVSATMGFDMSWLE